MESYKKLIGKKIQARRIEMGFETQDQLCQIMEVDVSQITKWETGVHLPEGKNKKALGTILNVEDDFFEMIDLAPETREHLIGEILEVLLKLDYSGLETAKMSIEGLAEIHKKPSAKSGENS